MYFIVLEKEIFQNLNKSKIIPNTCILPSCHLILLIIWLYIFVDWDLETQTLKTFLLQVLSLFWFILDLIWNPILKDWFVTDFCKCLKHFKDHLHLAWFFSSVFFITSPDCYGLDTERLPEVSCIRCLIQRWSYSDIFYGEIFSS